MNCEKQNYTGQTGTITVLSEVHEDGQLQEGTFLLDGRHDRFTLRLHVSGEYYLILSEAHGWDEIGFVMKDREKWFATNTSAGSCRDGLTPYEAAARWLWLTGA